MLSHGNISWRGRCHPVVPGYRQDDKVLAALPMSFDHGLYQIILAFAAGASVLLERSFGLVQQVLAHRANGLRCSPACRLCCIAVSDKALGRT